MQRTWLEKVCERKRAMDSYATLISSFFILCFSSHHMTCPLLWWYVALQEIQSVMHLEVFSFHPLSNNAHFLSWELLTLHLAQTRAYLQKSNNEVSKSNACCYYLAVKLITAHFGRDMLLCELGDPCFTPFLSAECICSVHFMPLFTNGRWPE